MNRAEINYLKSVTITDLQARLLEFFRGEAGSTSTFAAVFARFDLYEVEQVNGAIASLITQKFVRHAGPDVLCLTKLGQMMAEGI